MKKMVFLIPYFGKLPNYFNLWLKSCEVNSSIDWILFIDDQSSFNFPKNVIVNYCDFEYLKAKISNALKVPIILNNPYQLCEFKVAYGVIFKDFISAYAFWGFCDIDVIWGKLTNFITDDILNDYDKIGWRGHLTLFRNIDEISEYFWSEINRKNWCEVAFCNESRFPLAPDEGVINYIFENSKFKTYSNLPFADLKIRSYDFQCLHSIDSIETDGDLYQIFFWDNGLYRYAVNNNKMECHEFAYIHFLKRPMKISQQLSGCELTGDRRFWIIPNKFLGYNELVLSTDIVKVLGRKRFYWSYILSRITLRYFSNKVYHFQNRRNFKKKYGRLNFNSPNYAIDLKQKTVRMDEKNNGFS
jgi:hypothetical protein